MSETVNRVAHAIDEALTVAYCQAMSGDLKPSMDMVARAAILAMREPTIQMRALDDLSNPWEAMIDEALR